MHVWHIKSPVKNTLGTHWEKGEEFYCCVLRSPSHRVNWIAQRDPQSPSCCHLFYTHHYTPSGSGLRCGFQVIIHEWWTDYQGAVWSTCANNLVKEAFHVLTNTKSPEFESFSVTFDSMWNQSIAIIQVARLSPEFALCYAHLRVFNPTAVRARVTILPAQIISVWLQQTRFFTHRVFNYRHLPKRSMC